MVAGGRLNNADKGMPASNTWFGFVDTAHFLAGSSHRAGPPHVSTTGEVR